VDPRAGLDDLEKRKFLTLPGQKNGELERIWQVAVFEWKIEKTRKKIRDG
jgi:hypothetical protein